LKIEIRMVLKSEEGDLNEVWELKIRDWGLGVGQEDKDYAGDCE
jgi:hypothetical protein